VCRDPPRPPVEEISPPPVAVEKIAEVLAVLAEPNRLKILYLLRQSPMPVCFLSHILGLDRTAVSHHLARLKAAGLVKVTRSGHYSIYSLSEEGRRWVDAMFSV